jgi:hypothetical protein
VHVPTNRHTPTVQTSEKYYEVYKEGKKNNEELCRSQTELSKF